MGNRLGKSLWAESEKRSVKVTSWWDCATDHTAQVRQWTIFHNNNNNKSLNKSRKSLDHRIYSLTGDFNLPDTC